MWSHKIEKFKYVVTLYISMFIEIRKKGKKILYYLTYSFREKDKTRKIRRYLGSNLSKKELEKLKKRAEEMIKEQIKSYKTIRNPLNYILSTKEIKELEKLNIKETIRINHLSKRDWLHFTERFTYDTNAIEGSTVTFHEVENIIENDEWPQDTSKWEISETYGVAGAVDYIRETKVHISLRLIRDLHRFCFKNSKDFAGKIRPKGVEVGIRDKFGNIIHRGAPSQSVTSLLKELIKWYDENKKKYPPLLLAVVVHNQFENIHPFQDGNGRVGRLLLNNILLKNGLPPMNIELKNRQEYYQALQMYEHEGNLRPMIDLILKEYKTLKKQLKNM